EPGDEHHRECDGQYTRVHDQFHAFWQVSAGSGKGLQRFERQTCDGSAQRPSSQKQQETLDQELPDETAASRTDRGAHNRFSTPRYGARQEEVRNIRARNQQNQRDRSERQHQTALRLGGDRRVVLPERRDVKSAPFVCGRKLLRETVSNESKQRIGLPS